jgi:hypothetical protein
MSVYSGCGVFSKDLSRLPVEVKNGRHNHSVQFYGDDSVLLDDVSRYVGAALGSGGSSIVIATPAHREGLRKCLRLLGFDISYPKLKKRYLEFDAAHTLSKFMVDGMPHAASFSEIVTHVLVKAKVAAECQPARVAAFGEMVALLWAQGNAGAAIALERLWNDLAHTNTFDLHCAYPKSAFAPGHEDHFLTICREHSRVTSGEGEIPGVSRILQ